MKKKKKNNAAQFAFGSIEKITNDDWMRKKNNFFFNFAKLACDFSFGGFVFFFFNYISNESL